MTTAICIPLYDRLRYLPQVLEGVDRMAEVETAEIIYGLSPKAAGTLICRTPSRNVNVAVDSVNISIADTFDEAFQCGAKLAIYLADDCIPSKDFLRIARHMAAHREALAFGLWWPNGDKSLKYLELIVAQRGHVWPSKAFGCTAERWIELGPVLRSRNATGTFDSILAQYLWETRSRLLCPVVSRVKDIGRFGSYDTPEVWDRGFSWIAAAPDYDGTYTVLP